MFRGTMTVAVSLALVAPAAAQASTKPEVTTGGVSNVAPTSVTLNGKVDPNRAETTYFFQIGTTRLYTVNTAERSAGAGGKPIRVSADVTGLASATRYHYRLVARNRHGLAFGSDRTFKTQVQPLGVTLAANPPVVAPGGSTTLAGQLTGTNNAGRQVLLQSSVFPYTGGFVNAGNPQVTDAAGNFAFPVLSVPFTTQFRVVMPQRPEVVSPIVIVGAALQVTTDADKVERFRHSVAVRFHGSVRPQRDGARVNIQKLRHGVWETIAHTHARDAGTARSKYRTRVRIHRSGDFRVLVESAGEYVSGAGRTIHIRAPR